MRCLYFIKTPRPWNNICKGSMIPWGSTEKAGLGMKFLKGLELRSTVIINDGLHMQLLPFFAFMADINVQSQGFFLLYWRAHKKEPLFIRQLPRHKVSNRIQAGLQDKTYLPHLIFLENT